MDRVTQVLKELPKEELIIRKEKGEYIVEGPAAQRLMGRINVEDNESMHYFQKSIQKLGIEEKLKQMGVKEGDTVRVVDWEFEWCD